MRIGPVELSAVKDWDPAPGVLVSWHPTPPSCAKALGSAGECCASQLCTSQTSWSFSEQAEWLDHLRLLIAPVEVFVTAICAP